MERQDEKTKEQNEMPEQASEEMPVPLPEGGYRSEHAIVLPLETHGKSLRAFIVEFFQEHPGLIVTAAYLLLTAIGITYDVLYYEHFRIPILAFSVPGDHLLAGFRRPVLLGLFIFSVYALWRLILRHKRMREDSVRYRSLAEKMERKMIFSNWVLYPMVVVIYFLCTTSLYAEYMARRILEGHGKRLIVELMANGTSAKVDAKPAILIGTNSQFLFLFVPEERKATVVPLSSVSRMVLLSSDLEKAD